VRSPSITEEDLIPVWVGTENNVSFSGKTTQLESPRADGSPFVTDEGHHILDCALPAGADLAALDGAVKGLTGVVEHGLFLTQASAALLGAPDGSLQRLLRP